MRKKDKLNWYYYTLINYIQIVAVHKVLKQKLEETLFLANYTRKHLNSNQNARHIEEEEYELDDLEEVKRQESGGDEVNYIRIVNKVPDELKVYI